MKKKLIRILNKLGILGVFNFSLRTKINHKNFKIPVINRLGLDNVDLTESWMVELLEKILIDKQNKLYVDVGVNIGQTLLKLKSVNEEIPYFGFEPNPICNFYTRELVKMNGFKNVTIFPVGVSNKTSVYELSFYTDDDTDTSASILKNFRENKENCRKSYIACFDISDIADQYDFPSIGILKVDVEGAEKEVLESFKNRIIADQPYIQLEILPVYKRENKERFDRQEALELFCKEINYSMLRIHTDNSRRLTYLEEIETIGIHSNLNWCEYLIVPVNAKENIKTRFQISQS